MTVAQQDDTPTGYTRNTISLTASAAGAEVRCWAKVYTQGDSGARLPINWAGLSAITSSSACCDNGCINAQVFYTTTTLTAGTFATTLTFDAYGISTVITASSLDVTCFTFSADGTCGSGAPALSDFSEPATYTKWDYIGVCFPADATLRVLRPANASSGIATHDWATVHMEDVAIGDEVECVVPEAGAAQWDSAAAPLRLTTCAVYYYHAAHHAVVQPYVHLHYAALRANSSSVERDAAGATGVVAAIPEHFLMAPVVPEQYTGAACPPGVPRRFGDVRAGDWITARDPASGLCYTARVQRVTSAARRGAYVPLLTNRGLLVVDGAVAYTTAFVSKHLVYAPVEAAYLQLTGGSSTSSQVQVVRGEEAVPQGSCSVIGAACLEDAAHSLMMGAGAVAAARQQPALPMVGLLGTSTASVMHALLPSTAMNLAPDNTFHKAPGCTRIGARMRDLASPLPPVSWQHLPAVARATRAGKAVSWAQLERLASDLQRNASCANGGCAGAAWPVLVGQERVQAALEASLVLAPAGRKGPAEASLT